MSDLLAGALSILLATNQPVALSNLVARKTGFVLNVENTATNDPVGLELQKLMDTDDAAQEEINRWIDEAESPTNSPNARITLQGRIDQRFESVKRSYEEFLRLHPERADARLAYGSFLVDMGEETAGAEQWEKARLIEPSNPAAWNNLANYYGHRGPVTNAFAYYQKAIELNPKEPIYYHNLGTTVFMFRKDAREHWGIDEQQVFRKALDLYEQSRQLDPDNFILASDIATTYYGIKPPPADTPDAKRAAELKLAEEAMRSWTNALTLAGGPVELEGVRVHLARWSLRAGRYDDARAHLAGITLPVYEELRRRIERNLNAKAPATNPPPVLR